VGKGHYTPCPGCAYFIEWDDEVHASWCPVQDLTDYGPCTSTCPTSGICDELHECWNHGLEAKLIRHGDLGLLDYFQELTLTLCDT